MVLNCMEVFVGVLVTETIYRLLGQMPHQLATVK